MIAELQDVIDKIMRILPADIKGWRVQKGDSISAVVFDKAFLSNGVEYDMFLDVEVLDFQNDIVRLRINSRIAKRVIAHDVTVENAYASIGSFLQSQIILMDAMTKNLLPKNFFV